MIKDTIFYAYYVFTIFLGLLWLNPNLALWVKIFIDAYFIVNAFIWGYSMTRRKY